MINMDHIQLPKDALSHSQIKSKIWLGQSLRLWHEKHLDKNQGTTINWYGCWVGTGPFVVLINSNIKVLTVNLFDLDAHSLNTANELLEYWRCDWTKINTYCIDVNEHSPSTVDHNQIFINTACEHMTSLKWLENIPTGSFVILQSTNLSHPEHTNAISNRKDFLMKYSEYLNILDSGELQFNYPDKKFSRYMLIGKKK